MDTWAWSAFTAAVALAGLAAVDGLRPARAGHAHARWSLLLGTAGMLLGLWLDSRAGGIARLAALCTAGEAESVDVLGWHWSQLPRAHLGMLAGSLLPLLALLRPGAGGRQRLAGQVLACTGWMFLGMAAGTLAFSEFAAWLTGSLRPAPLLGGMVAGMVWGMAVSRLLAQRERAPGWRHT